MHACAERHGKSPEGAVKPWCCGWHRGQRPDFHWTLLVQLTFLPHACHYTPSEMNHHQRCYLIVLMNELLAIRKNKWKIPCQITINKTLLYWSSNFRKFSHCQGAWTSHIRFLSLRVRVLEEHRHSKFLEPHGEYRYLLEKDENYILLKIPSPAAVSCNIEQISMPSQTSLF